MKTFQPLDRVRYIPTGKIYVVRKQFLDGEVSLEALHDGEFAQFYPERLELVTPAPNMDAANGLIAEAEDLVKKIENSKKLDRWQRRWVWDQVQKMVMSK